MMDGRQSLGHILTRCFLLYLGQQNALIRGKGGALEGNCGCDLDIGTQIMRKIMRASQEARVPVLGTPLDVTDKK